MTFTIYHGHASKQSLKKARESAPSYEHRQMCSEFVNTRGCRYALDNGAFSCWKNGRDWIWSERADQFVRMINRACTEKERKPDFVVLPDVVSEAEQTYRRSVRWTNIIRWELGHDDVSLYLAAQEGMSVAGIVETCDRWDLDGVFVGGQPEFKKSITPELAETDYPVHVGRPGDILLCKEMGADSCDTTSIVSDGSWHRLERLENQQSLTESSQSSLTG